MTTPLGSTTYGEVDSIEPIEPDEHRWSRYVIGTVNSLSSCRVELPFEAGENDEDFVEGGRFVEEHDVLHRIVVALPPRATFGRRHES